MQIKAISGDNENSIIYIINTKTKLRPEFFLACGFHLALAFGTGVPIPDADVVAAAVEAEPADLAPVRRCHVGDDAPHHDVLDGLAVRARHGGYLLTEEATPLVHLSLIPTRIAAIFQFPSHKQ